MIVQCMNLSDRYASRFSVCNTSMKVNDDSDMSMRLRVESGVMR